MIEKRFNPENKLYLSQVSFKNLKESLNSFLYEADKNSDYDTALKLIPYL